MNKGIWAGLVAIAFVAGSIMTGTMAYAASNAQGQPFQQLQQQIDEIKAQIGIGEDNFTVDSFFDVFYQIDMSGDQCRTGDIPKLNEDLTDTDCSSDFAVDSFFDIFYRIETDTKRNTENIGEIQTELVALELRSLPPVCTSGDVVKYNGLTGLWECAVDQTGAGVETDPQVGTLVSGQWCRSDGTKVDCDVTPVNAANFARLDATNTFGPPQRFGDVDVGNNLRVGNRMDVAGPTNLGSLLDVTGPGVFRNTLSVQGASAFSSNMVVSGPITSVNSMTAPTVRGTDQVCIGSDCRNAWPSGGSSGRLQVIAREDPTPATFVGPVTDSFAPCLSGEIVVGGGYRTGSGVTNVFAEFSAFTAEGFGWLVSAHNPTGVGTVTAIAYCATIVP